MRKEGNIMKFTFERFWGTAAKMGRLMKEGSRPSRVSKLAHRLAALEMAAVRDGWTYEALAEIAGEWILYGQQKAKG